MNKTATQSSPNWNLLISERFDTQYMLYGLAIIASIFISFFIDIRQAVINPDAICYLSSAQTMPQGISAAMNICGQAHWPLYAALIHIVTKVTSLSYSDAAYVLNGAFSIISVLTFITIVKTLGGTKRTMWLAAAVILLSHDFNSVREYIVRDHGFWAFYLLSILFLIRYTHVPQFYKALGWSFTLIAATLFRIEGAIFLLVLPFVVFVLPANLSFFKRLQMFFNLHVLSLCLGALGLSWVLTHPQQLDKLGRLPEIIQQFQQGFHLVITRYQQSQAAVATHVLNSNSARDAGIVLTLLLIVWYLSLLVRSLTWGYAALVIFAWWQQKKQVKKFIVLIAYLLVNVIITSIFLLERFFLSKRYLLALSLVLMLWVPFAMDEVLRKSSVTRYRYFFLAIIVLIFISAAGGVFEFGYSKKYLRNAGDWLASHVGSSTTLYTNDYQLMYYSKHFEKNIFQKARVYYSLNLIADNAWQHYDFIALRVNKKDAKHMQPILQAIQFKPIKKFHNERGDQVIIYKR